MSELNKLHCSKLSSSEVLLLAQSCASQHYGKWVFPVSFVQNECEVHWYCSNVVCVCVCVCMSYCAYSVMD